MANEILKIPHNFKQEYLAGQKQIVAEYVDDNFTAVAGVLNGKIFASEQEVTEGVVDNKAISAKELKKLIQSFKATKVGTMLFSYADLLDEYLLCNGAAISRNTYSDLFSVIGTKFGVGDGTTTFNIPDMRGRVLQGANGNSGTYVNAGLPNIWGHFVMVTASGNFIKSNGASGAFSATGHAGTDAGSFSGVYGSPDIHFNASSSNGIYGASHTVQPPALLLNCFIKY